MNIDTILTDNREIESSERAILEEEVSSEIHRIETKDFYKCANASDPDYEYVQDRNCEGIVAVDRDRLLCNECVLLPTRGTECPSSLNKCGMAIRYSLNTP